ncbi:hypothetical protein [Methylobacterium radiodurans]|uniref:Uncharacterized protein n=1 Tax=Methylobacterium radiodurans TaxID=2202828 RepID=A0A2U8VSC0_9HYPH|nr:hypothetical protein [Methylobacterium radiodurans]AWN36368.1 hypothetical protein DK427_12050 [Methylobacterium radiodurans]
MAELFLATHSKLAALIADPIKDVSYIGIETLRVRLQEILPPDEIKAISQRAMMRLAAEAELEVPPARRLQRDGACLRGAASFLRTRL